MNSTKWIGITGNIASGKSTVSEILKQKGYPVLDADHITNSVYQSETAENKTIRERIKTLFGTLDKAKIRTSIFADSTLKHELEKILHPYIRSLSELWYEEQKSLAKPFAFYEASLLIETGIPKEMFGVLLITADDTTRKNRLKTRNSALKDSDIENILKAQIPQENKRKTATWCIDNNSDDVQELAAKVSDWLSLLKS